MFCPCHFQHSPPLTFPQAYEKPLRCQKNLLKKLDFSKISNPEAPFEVGLLSDSFIRPNQSNHAFKFREQLKVQIDFSTDSSEADVLHVASRFKERLQEAVKISFAFKKFDDEVYGLTNQSQVESCPPLLKRNEPLTIPGACFF